MIRTLDLPKSPFTFKRNDILPTARLDEGVYEIQQYALQNGFIPIAGIISREIEPGKHQILGGGHNWLRDGIPGVHGETGAVKDMGRIQGGYRDLVATSSLSPCPFCQRCLALHLGITRVRILDDINYSPDKSSYSKAGISPEVVHHAGIADTFKRWERDPANSILWNRDIGIPAFPERKLKPFQTYDWSPYLERANRLAREGLAAGEAPIGVVIVDEFGEVAAASYAQIKKENDPSCTAFVSAWRKCGSRDDWGKHTVVCSAGADHIAWSGFNIFKFGQFVSGSTSVFSGQTDAIASLPGQWPGQTSRPVFAFQGRGEDEILRKWILETPLSEVQEYLGSDFTGLPHVSLSAGTF